MPLKNTENVLVFSFGGCAHPAKNRMKYNPQGVIKVSKVCKQRKIGKYLHKGGMPTAETFKQRGTGYPTQIIKINKESKTLHPTQKPVALFEYLIKTYTNEGDLVLDNCIGSGTTAVACIQTGRHFIGIEKELEYCEVAKKRIAPARQAMKEIKRR
jgi:site-specific DNA-methyltransferase (adenine-specific)